MKNKLTLLSCTLISVLLVGCGGDSSPFVPGGGQNAGSVIDIDKFTFSSGDLFPELVSVTYGDGAINPATEIQSIDSISVNNTFSISVIAADRFRRLVPGATITFRTNYGSIEPTCTLDTTGFCTVDIISLGSLPLESGLLFNGFVNNDNTQNQSIFMNIIAYTQGEESFVDINGNGFFDDGDVFLIDIDEPYIDNNNNGVYDLGVDIIIDLDNDGAYTPADGLYSGSNCQHSSLCSPNSSIVIWARQYIDLVSSN